MKKLLSLVCAVLLICSLGSTAFATDQYVYSDGSVTSTVECYVPENFCIIIPAVIEGGTWMNFEALSMNLESNHIVKVYNAETVNGQGITLTNQSGQTISAIVEGGTSGCVGLFRPGVLTSEYTFAITTGEAMSGAGTYSGTVTFNIVTEPTDM